MRAGPLAAWVPGGYGQALSAAPVPARLPPRRGAPGGMAAPPVLRRFLAGFAQQVGDALAGHQLTSFPAAIRPRSSSSSVCTRLTSSRTFAAYLPRYWITVCLFTIAVEYAR